MRITGPSFFRVKDGVMAWERRLWERLVSREKIFMK